MGFFIFGIEIQPTLMIDCFMLGAAVQVSKINDCCYRKQPLHQDFREGQLYTLKLPVESHDHQVTALACAELALSTEAV